MRNERPELDFQRRGDSFQVDGKPCLRLVFASAVLRIDMQSRWSRQIIEHEKALERQQ